MGPLKRRNYDLSIRCDACNSEPLHTRKVPVVDGGDVGGMPKGVWIFFW